MTTEELIGRVVVSLQKAEKGETKLPAKVLKMDGMSSPKVRSYLNSLCSYPEVRYLEVGTAAGSTHVSAMWGNLPEYSYASDLWVEKKNAGGKQAFLDNCSRFLTSGHPIEEVGARWRLISGDCFQINLDELEKGINLYFFDGGHEVEDHRKAVTYFDDILDDRFIMVIDDWNDARVQEGTIRGLEESGYNVVFAHYCRANPGSTPPAWGDMNEWWNGLMTFVLEKK